MRAFAIFATLFAVLSGAAALRHGDIDTHVAVRSDGKGGIEHFYKKDADEYFRKRSMEKRNHERLDGPAAVERANEPRTTVAYSDPNWSNNSLLSDTIAVKGDGSGISNAKKDQQAQADTA